jgi:hypothetical protein
MGVAKTHSGGKTMPKKKSSKKRNKVLKLIKTHKKLKLQLKKVEGQISDIPYPDIPYGSDIPYRDKRKR